MEVSAMNHFGCVNGWRAFEPLVDERMASLYGAVANASLWKAAEGLRLDRVVRKEEIGTCFQVESNCTHCPAKIPEDLTQICLDTKLIEKRANERALVVSVAVIGVLFIMAAC